MIRSLIISLALILALQSAALGQGFFESLLGPSGLGIMGPSSPSGQTLQRFNSPNFYGGQSATQPAQPYGQQAPQYGQPGYAPQGQGYSPQSQYAPQGYGYPNQYGQPGAVPGQPNYNYQYGAPPQAGTQPPVRYSAPPSSQPQASAPAQQQSPQSAPLRPGQYSRDQRAPRPEELPDVPPGAVRIITETPDGTTVQYYPPPGSAQPQPQTAGPPSQQRRPKPASAGVQRPERPKRTRQSRGSTKTEVAMPQPVQIPSGSDPRLGWDANRRGPAQPQR